MGGRAALNPALADVLRGLGRIVYLRVDEPELWRRVSKTGRPAFLTSDDPRAEFMELCRQRRPAYERLADVTVDLDAADVDESLRRLRQAIEENPNAR
jgi:shikimate kinase